MALTVALFAVVPAIAIPQIEKELTTRAAAALRAAGVDWASVRADGRSIAIEGEAPTPETQAQAIQSVAALDGVRSVVDGTTVRPPHAYALQITRDDSGLTLEGEVPDAATVAAIRDAVAEVTPDLAVDSVLETVPGTPVPGWREAAIRAGRQAAQLFSGRVALTDGEISVTGTVLDQPTLDALGVAADTENAYAATIEVSVLQPRLYELTLSRRGDRLTLSGEAPDEDSREALIALAERQNVPLVEAEDLRLERGIATETWHPITSAMIRHVSAMQEAEARLEPGRLTLSGTVANPAMAALIRTALTSAFSDGSGMELDIDIRASDHAGGVSPELTDTEALLEYADTAEIPQVDPEIRLDPGACQTALNGLIADERIRFIGGGADLDPGSGPLLERIALTMRQCDNVLIEVSGHIPSVDEAQDGEALSAEMARAVVDYLVRRGVDEAIMVSTGYADMVPIADNVTEGGRARNRRIEFLVAPAG